MASRFQQTHRALTAADSHVARWTWLAAGGLLLMWGCWFLLDRVEVYEVSARARVEALQAPHHVATLAASQVIASDLAIGREVRAGDVLVSLDARVEIMRLREEEARLKAIPPRIAALRREAEARRRERSEAGEAAQAAAEVARQRSREAEILAQFAAENDRRFARLGAMGTASVADTQRVASEAQRLGASRDALIADVRRIEREAAMRDAQLAAQVESLDNAVAQLEGDHETGSATIERLQGDIERLTIRAPVDGRIGDAVPLHAGAYLAQGQRIATVVPPGALTLVADFNPSATVGRVKPGQTARLRLDSYPWAQYGIVTATVRRVASEIRDNAVRVEFSVEAVPDSGITMQHGLSGSVEVAVETVSPARLALRAAGFLLPASARARTTP